MAILNPTQAIRELYSLARYGSYTFSQPDLIPAPLFREGAFVSGISNDRTDGGTMWLHVVHGKDRAYGTRVALDEKSIGDFPVWDLVRKVGDYRRMALDRELNLMEIAAAVEDCGGSLAVPGRPDVAVFDSSRAALFVFKADSVVKDEKTGVFYVQGRDALGKPCSSQLVFLRDDEVLSVYMGSLLDPNRPKITVPAARREEKPAIEPGVAADRGQARRAPKGTSVPGKGTGTPKRIPVHL